MSLGWTREPLVHFLGVGALVFLLLTWRGGDVDPASRSIVIDREKQAEIALVFERTMGRPPTDIELDSQIERYIRDEVLYREALRLGLDQYDGVVRRRMAQKMDFLASAQAETASPSNETLRQHYDDNQDIFATNVKYTFDHLWFEEPSSATQAIGKGIPLNNWEILGEPISLPPSVFEIEDSRLINQFGRQFVENLSSIEVNNEWQGPIKSGFGWHLVRLRSRQPSELRRFEAVLSEVEDHWRTQTIAERKLDAYGILRDAYVITIDQ